MLACLCVQEKEDDFVSALDNYKKALDLLMSLLQGIIQYVSVTSHSLRVCVCVFELTLDHG